MTVSPSLRLEKLCGVDGSVSRVRMEDNAASFHLNSSLLPGKEDHLYHHNQSHMQLRFFWCQMIAATKMMDADFDAKACILLPLRIKLIIFDLILLLLIHLMMILN